MEAAVDWLRKKGIAKADKKSGRTAAEGLIAVASEGNSAVVVEVNSETDFVARNDAFQDLARNDRQCCPGHGRFGRSGFGAPLSSTGKSVDRHRQGRVAHDRREHEPAPFGQAFGRRRCRNLCPQRGCRWSWQARRLVAIEVDRQQGCRNDRPSGRHAHVAATNPLALTSDDVDPAVAERERNVFIEQARESGKPENIIEKMVEGRMRKFYEEVALPFEAGIRHESRSDGRKAVGRRRTGNRCTG
jgi:elongation factor Ts